MSIKGRSCLDGALIAAKESDSLKFRQLTVDGFLTTAVLSKYKYLIIREESVVWFSAVFITLLRKAGLLKSSVAYFKSLLLSTYRDKSMA